MNRDQIKTEIVDISQLEVHPVALLNPTITGLQFEALRDDIESKGQLEPVDATYDYKVFNGRTRLAVLKSLNIKEVKVKRQPKGLSQEEMMELADSLENRRHATPTQLAIKAWKLWQAGTYNTMTQAAKAVGISVKQVQRINIIGGSNQPLPAKQYQRFNRTDILEILFDGKKVVIEGYQPTDSPQTIINMLDKMGKVTTRVEVPTIEEEELTVEELGWVQAMYESYSDQSKAVKQALMDKLSKDIL